MTTIDDLATSLRTHRHGRAALGVAAENLRRAYEVLDTIRPSWQDGMIEDIADAPVREQGRDLLDRTRAYAEGLYATLRDSDDPLPEERRPMIREALSQAESNLQLIERVRGELVQPFVQDMEDTIDAIASATVQSVEFLADKARKVVNAVVPQAVWWLLGGAVIVAAGVAAWRLSAK